MVACSSPALFWHRRLAALALFFGATVSCFGHPAFLTVPATPYDRQMVRVRPSLAAANKGPGAVSSLSINRWMSELRAIPYHYSGRWQTPAEVNFAQTADCKGKAVALYAQMRRNGAQNLRIVIGKHFIHNSVTHAWLEWDKPEGSFMLDPTFNETPVKTAELDPMSYLPFYAYDGAHKYRVANAGPIPQTTRVATGGTSHRYIPATTRTTFARPGLNGGGTPSLYSATPTQYLYPPRSTRDNQSAWSNARRLSSQIAGGFRRAAGPVVSPETQYLVSPHPIAAVSQKRATPGTRHLTSNVRKHSHAGRVAHHGHRATRSRVTRLASSK